MGRSPGKLSGTLREDNAGRFGGAGTGLMLSISDIERLACGKVGTFDAPCSACGPERRSPANQVRKVLRVWRINSTFATYRCARCDVQGHHAREEGAVRPDPAELEKSREAARQFAATAAEGETQESALAMDEATCCRWYDRRGLSPGSKTLRWTASAFDRLFTIARGLSPLNDQRVRFPW